MLYGANITTVNYAYLCLCISPDLTNEVKHSYKNTYVGCNISLS